MSRRLATALVVTTLVCLASTPTQASDPYAAPATAAPEVERLVRDALFGLPGADHELQSWLEGHPAAPAVQRRLGYHTLCNIYGARALNAARARVCAAEQAAGAKDEDVSLSQALSIVPPVRAIGSTTVPLVKNNLSGTSADVTVNGVTLPWFVDTGAEITTISKSVAARLRVRALGRSIPVGTSTRQVRGELAVIDLLRIGDAWVENVPVLVLPDANLQMGPGAAIPAILGLPVFNAFGRMAWLDHGTKLALGETAPPVTDARYRIYWHEDGVGIPLVTAAGTMGAHFDTGANRTNLRSPFLPLLTGEERAAAFERELQTGGAGGVISRREKHFPSVRISVAGVPFTLENIPLDSRDATDAARAGMDLIFPVRLFVLDFEHMTMRVER